VSLSPPCVVACLRVSLPLLRSVNPVAWLSLSLSHIPPIHLPYHTDNDDDAHPAAHSDRLAQHVCLSLLAFTTASCNCLPCPCNAPLTWEHLRKPQHLHSRSGTQEIPPYPLQLSGHVAERPRRRPSERCLLRRHCRSRRLVLAEVHQSRLGRIAWERKACTKRATSCSNMRRNRRSTA
jgi:hypothetical protein